MWQAKTSVLSLVYIKYAVMLLMHNRLENIRPPFSLRYWPCNYLGAKARIRGKGKESRASMLSVCRDKEMEC